MNTVTRAYTMDSLISGKSGRRSINDPAQKCPMAQRWNARPSEGEVTLIEPP